MEDQDGIWTRRNAMSMMGSLAVGSSSTAISRPSPDVGALTQKEGTTSGAVASVTDFGASGDGSTDDTTAFRAAIDFLTGKGGGSLVLPNGDFRTTTIFFPYDPVVINVLGSGSRSTVWRMADPTKPIIAIDRSTPPNRVTGSSFSDFTVAAHARGRVDRKDHVAIDAQGFSDVLFRNIRFLSEGQGSVGALFYTSASRHLTYNQRFERISIEKCVGPGKVIATGSNSGYLGHTNLIFVDGFWIYSNREMNTAFDFNHSSLYAVRNGLIESSGEYGILLGNAGLVESVWFEAQERAPLRFLAQGSGAASSNNLLQNLYLSGFGGKIEIPVGCVNNTLQNVTGDNFQIVTADPLTGNVTTSSGGQGNKPALSQVHGADARWKEVEVLKVSALDGLWQILYLVEFPAAGNYSFRFDPPAGRRITKIAVTALDGSDGTAVPCALGWPVHEFYISAKSNRPLSVVAQLSYE